MHSIIAEQLMVNEEVLWEGRPKKNAYLLSKSAQLLPIGVAFLVFDLFFITMLISTMEDMPTGIILFLVVFFALHLTPFWLALSKIVRAHREHSFEEYAITNKRVIIVYGTAQNVDSIMYEEIVNVTAREQFTDRIFGVFDIVLETTRTKNPVLYDLPEGKLVHDEILFRANQAKPTIPEPTAPEVATDARIAQLEQEIEALKRRNGNE